MQFASVCGLLLVVLFGFGAEADADPDPRGFTEDPLDTEEKFREKGKGKIVSLWHNMRTIRAHICVLTNYTPGLNGGCGQIHINYAYFTTEENEL
jgi:hypothetical protein